MSRALIVRVAVGVVLIGVLGAWFLMRGEQLSPGEGQTLGGITGEVADQPSFEITSPQEGSSVASPGILDIELRNAELGQPTEGLNHLHVSLDGGQATASYKSTKWMFSASPGEHTFAVEVAGPDHAPLQPAKTVTFTVSK